MGRSQLNAVTENTLNDSTPAGAAAKLSQPHPPHEQGETQMFLAVFAVIRKGLEPFGSCNNCVRLCAILQS